MVICTCYLSAIRWELMSCGHSAIPFQDASAPRLRVNAYEISKEREIVVVEDDYSIRSEEYLLNQWRFSLLERTNLLRRSVPRRETCIYCNFWRKHLCRTNIECWNCSRATCSALSDELSSPTDFLVVLHSYSFIPAISLSLYLSLFPSSSIVIELFSLFVLLPWNSSLPSIWIEKERKRDI